VAPGSGAHAARRVLSPLVREPDNAQVLKRRASRVPSSLPQVRRPDRMAHRRLRPLRLTDYEIVRIARMDSGKTLFFDHHDPEWHTRRATRRVD